MKTPRNLVNTVRLGDRLVIINDRTGTDGFIDVNKPDDIQLPIKQRLGTYLSTLTANASNNPAIATGYSEILSHDQQGNVADLTDSGAGNQESFGGDMAAAGAQGTTAIRVFAQSSRSGLLDTDNSPFVIRRGKENTTAPSIQDVITDLNEKGGNSDFEKRLDQVLFNNNRFREGKSYVPRNGIDRFDSITTPTPGSQGETSVTEDNSNLGLTIVQQQFGTHGPRKFPNTDTESTVMQLVDLKKLGLLTMLQASGEVYVPTDPNDVAQQLAARGTSLVPGLARMGQKVGVNRFAPLKVMHDVNPSFVKPSLDDNIVKNEVLSYGNVNNWMAPFGGLVDTAGIASAGLLLVVVGGLMKSLASLLAPTANTSEFPSSPNPSRSDRKRRLGSYLGKDTETSAYKNDLIQLDVYQTRHNFFSCVDRGINIFFDAQTGPVPTAGKLLRHHGYYNTVLRNIVRSTTDFFMLSIDSTVNTTPPNGSFSINDVTVVGNPLALGALVDKMNGSALLKFVNIVASIGDVALSHDDDGYPSDLNGQVNTVISDIDLIPETFTGQDIFNQDPLNPAILQGKSRLQDSSLAWKQGSVQSLYLLPHNILDGVATFVGSTNQGGNPIYEAFDSLRGNNIIIDPKTPSRESNGRIDADVVKKMEDYLEADYMPFYWHDLRTNEIISFHAFLEDVSDGFDAEYQEIEGYGRIGTVPVYKNTKRSISLAFRVVATNPYDFDQMWWKINKFVTLVYPQYTMGRQVGIGTQKFIQPFSQVPSASPLVRLRVGDLFKTNYSTLAVARLFGIDSGQFQLDGLQSGSFAYDSGYADRVEQVRRRMEAGQFNQGEQAMLVANYSPGRGQNRRGYPRVDGAPPAGTNTRTRRGTAGSPQQNSLNSVVDLTNIPATGQDRSLRTASAVRVIVNNNTQINDPHSPFNLMYRVRLTNPGSGQDGVYLVHQTDLLPIPTEIDKAARLQGTNNTTQDNPGTTTPEAITTFFNSDPTSDTANPILKSFATTKGRGLAGFIKSIRFDWSDARWSTDRINGRAPMSMKLQVEFLPVHDLNPGVDHNGFNTAPVYNVGEVMRAYNKDPLDNNNNNDQVQNLFDTAQSKFVPTPGSNGSNSPVR